MGDIGSGEPLASATSAMGYKPCDNKSTGTRQSERKTRWSQMSATTNIKRLLSTASYLNSSDSTLSDIVIW